MNITIRTVQFTCIAAGLALGSFRLAAADQAPTTPPPPAPPGANGEHHHRRMEEIGVGPEMATQLGLSADQITQLKTLRETTRQQIKAIRDDASVTPEDKKARIRDTLANARQQAQQILTPEQQQKLKQLREERWAKHDEKTQTP